MKRGDIYLASLDSTKGHEQSRGRPVLIVSPDRFNQFTGVPVVLPITSGGAIARNAGFTVRLAGAGTRTTGFIRCDQPRSLDLKARHGRKIETVPSQIMDEVLSKVLTLFT